MDCPRAMARRRTPATTYLTEQATPHLTASTAAATPKLTSVYNQARPHRTDRFSTEGARRVGLGHLRRTRRAMQMAKSPRSLLCCVDRLSRKRPSDRTALTA